MYKLVSDSSADIYELQNVPFESVPLKISTDEHSWIDNKDMDVHNMLETLASFKGRSYSACPSVDAWTHAFEGADPIYVVTITSGLSGSYNSAMTAKNMYLETHPDAHIHVFDSLSTGPHVRMLLEKLAELNEQNLPFEEVVAKTEEYAKHVHLFYTLYSLHNLAQNGRVAKAVAAAVGVMHLRILGTTSPEGKLEPLTKCRGDKKLLSEYMKQLEEIHCSGKKFRIAHVENPEVAEMLKQKLLEIWPSADIVTTTAGGLDSFYGERGCIFLAAEDSL